MPKKLRLLLFRLALVGRIALHPLEMYEIPVRKPDYFYSSFAVQGQRVLPTLRDLDYFYFVFGRYAGRAPGNFESSRGFGRRNYFYFNFP